MLHHNQLRTLLLLLLLLGLGAFSHATEVTTPLRGSGDLAVVVERASGSVVVIDTTHYQRLHRITDLGDLSHASMVFSRDARYAFLFGRDGGLSKIDLLRGERVKRVVQAGNSIGGAISSDGRWVAVANYEPGGVRLFASDTLAPVADIPATISSAAPHRDASGAVLPLSETAAAPLAARSKVVGLVDAPQQQLLVALYDSGEIWRIDLRQPTAPQVSRYLGIGKQPYDALITPDGRFYLAGLFGEDGMALLDLWYPEQGVRRVLHHYGRGEQRLPVYKMPHLEGWAVAGREALVPAVGHHQLLILDTEQWQQRAAISLPGQPVFVMARPDGRQVWVNFAHPNNDMVVVIDVPSRQIIKQLQPGRAVLHMEFTPRGEAVWISSRDDNRIRVYDTATFALLAELPAERPSGIFMSARAHRTGL